ncbi:hypothetical protein V8E55_006148 [Tylopilus felleus]
MHISEKWVISLFTVGAFVPGCLGMLVMLDERTRTNKVTKWTLPGLMHRARQLNLPLRPTKLATLRGVSVGRYASTKTRQNRRTIDTEDDGDFRPPWVYSGSRFLTYTAIPLTLIYCAFLADWGEREHIFMPLRRWASKYGQSILSLSPEEAALVRGSTGPAPGGSSSAQVDKSS